MPTCGVGGGVMGKGLQVRRGVDWRIYERGWKEGAPVNAYQGRKVTSGRDCGIFTSPQSFSSIV